MSIDIIPEGQTIDPLKIAYEKLSKVCEFLRDKNFEDQADEVANVIDQFVGWCADSAQLDNKYPNDKYVKEDTEWRKKIGIN